MRKRPPEIREAPYGDWAIHCQPQPPAASAANRAGDFSPCAYPTGASPAIEPRWPTTRRRTRPRTATTPSCRRAYRDQKPGGAAGRQAGARHGAARPGPGWRAGAALRHPHRARRARQSAPQDPPHAGHPQRHGAAGHCRSRRPALRRRAGRAARDRPRHRQRRRAPGRRHRGRAAAAQAAVGARRHAARAGARPGDRPAQCRRDHALGRRLRRRRADHHRRATARRNRACSPNRRRARWSTST